MNKDDLLKHIAETAYNIGFGAKKHFSTYDIINKTPSYISFISMTFGIYALAFDGLSTKFLSASFLVLGIIGLYTSCHDAKKGDYINAGKELTDLFNELKHLYRDAKGKDNDLQAIEDHLIEIEKKYIGISISQQILFSDWYAHYKFFWQHQIGWIDEQKHFKLLRDKIPLSFHLTLFTIILSVIIWWNFDLLSNLLNPINP